MLVLVLALILCAPLLCTRQAWISFTGFRDAEKRPLRPEVYGTMWVFLNEAPPSPTSAEVEQDIDFGDDESSNEHSDDSFAGSPSEDD